MEGSAANVGESVRTIISTPVGPVVVRGHASGVTDVYFFREQNEYNDRKQTSGGVPGGGIDGVADIPAPVREAAKQLDEYFQGLRRQFDFPITVSGTAFQQSVWDYLLTIPYGESRTYGEIAAAIGKPGAARAVGGAVGSNPISIAIPCHRVLAFGNRLGGYGGGLETKRFLLQLEGIVVDGR